MRFHICLPDEEVAPLASSFHTDSAFSVLSHYLHSAKALKDNDLIFVLLLRPGCQGVVCFVTHSRAALSLSLKRCGPCAARERALLRPAADLLLPTGQPPAG